jgi:hypothetical protein
LNKGLVAVALCGVLVAVSIFGAYRFGASVNYGVGYDDGFTHGCLSVSSSAKYGSLQPGNYSLGWLQGNFSGYLAGYQAGILAGGNNGTG